MSCPENSDFLFGRCYLFMSEKAQSRSHASCAQLPRPLNQVGYWETAYIETEEQQQYVLGLMKDKNITSLWLGLYGSRVSKNHFDIHALYGNQTFNNWGFSNLDDRTWSVGAYISAEDGKWYLVDVNDDSVPRYFICTTEITPDGKVDCKRVEDKCDYEAFQKYASASDTCVNLQNYIHDTVDCLTSYNCSSSNFCNDTFGDECDISCSPTPIYGAGGSGNGSTQGSSTSSGEIAGIVIGCLLGAALVVGGSVFFYKKKAKKKPPINTNGSFSDIVQA